YLANDILQNSRRKGSEFVNEFWKVLPGALNKVVKNDDEHGKRVVLRLIEIWEERKVFGSRGSGLKDEMLAKEPPPSLENNGKSSHSIKIVRKDAHSIRLKLAIGGMPERIVSAFQSVHDDHFNEDTALNKCKAAIRRVGKMEKDVDDARSHGNQQESTLANELQEQETILRQCIAQLQDTEATRTALVAQLKEALQDQESKLELIRTQLQVAQAQAEQAKAMQQQLLAGPTSGPPELPSTVEPKQAQAQVATTTAMSSATHPHQPMPSQPLTSSVDMKMTSEEQKKTAAAVAAEVAAKLASSTSSAQMLTSVFSSLAAEEAASMNFGLETSSFGPSSFPADKRPKLEKPMMVTDTNSSYVSHYQQQQGGSLAQVPGQVSTSSLQPSPFPPLPPLPPPPIQQQYVQASGMMVGMPYMYSGNGLPPPPPLPPQMAVAKSGSTQMQQPAPQQQQQQQQQQQHGVIPGYYQAPNASFYTQGGTQPTQAVPR
ncbi:Regulation of nuclear pre-mRNA domain-containing protein 1B, partial [Nymphaea thermarum]